MQLGARLGDWTVLEELGRGGMGAVFKARHAITGEVAAVKVLTGVVDDTALKRFMREGQAGATVEHPNVLRALGAGREAGRPFVVFEYAPGGSLERRIKERGRVPWPEAAALGASVARGLAALHAAGFVHRDLKPANILFDASGAPRIADFGLVRPMEGGTILTETNAIVGTPAYLSPEQARGDVATEASDIYGLGCTLYAALAGEPPFKGGQYDVLRRHTSEAPPSLAFVPAELDALVTKKLLAKNPAERPSAGAVAAALDALGKHERGSRQTVVLAALLVASGTLALAARETRTAERPPEGVAPLSTAATSSSATTSDVDPSAEEAPLTSGSISHVGSAGEAAFAAASKALSNRAFQLRHAWGNTSLVHAGPVKATAFLPGDRFVTGAHGEFAVRCWSKDGTELWRGRGGNSVTCLVASPDGKRVLVGTDRSLAVLDAADGSVLPPFTFVNGERHPIQSPPVLAVTWDADGPRAVLVDGRWVSVTPDLAEMDPRASRSYSAGVIRGTGVFLVTSKGKVLLQGPSGLQVPIEVPFPVGSLAISPDGKTAFFAAKSPETDAALWDLEGGEAKLLSKVPAPSEGVFFLPDGSVGAFGRGVHVNVKGTTRVVVPPSLDVVESVTPSADGARAIVGRRSGNIELWDLDAAKRLLGPEIGALHDIVLSEDGRRALVQTKFSSAYVLDTEDGFRPLWHGAAPHALRSLTLSGDGGEVLGATFPGLLVRAHVGSDAGFAEVPEKDLATVLASRDASVLLELDLHGKVALVIGDERKTLPIDAKVRFIALRPDGAEALTWDEHANVLRWKLPELTSHAIDLVDVRSADAYERIRLDLAWTRIATIPRTDPHDSRHVEVWELATGKHIGTVTVGKNGNAIQDVSFRPRHRAILLAWPGGGVDRRGFDDRRLGGLNFRSVSDQPQAVVHRSDGRSLLVVTLRGMVYDFDYND